MACVPGLASRERSGLDAPPFPGCCCGDQGRPEITTEIIPANTANGTNATALVAPIPARMRALDLPTTDARRPEACDAVLTRGSHIVDGACRFSPPTPITTPPPKMPDAKFHPIPSRPVVSVSQQDSACGAGLGCRNIEAAGCNVVLESAEEQRLGWTHPVGSKHRLRRQTPGHPGPHPDRGKPSGLEPGKRSQS